MEQDLQIYFLTSKRNLKSKDVSVYKGSFKDTLCNDSHNTLKENLTNKMEDTENNPFGI